MLAAAGAALGVHGQALDPLPLHGPAEFAFQLPAGALDAACAGGGVQFRLARAVEPEEPIPFGREGRGTGHGEPVQDLPGLLRVGPFMDRVPGGLPIGHCPGA